MVHPNIFIHLVFLSRYEEINVGSYCSVVNILN